MGRNDEDIWQDPSEKHDQPGVAKTGDVQGEEIHRTGVQVSLRVGAMFLLHFYFIVSLV